VSRLGRILRSAKVIENPLDERGLFDARDDPKTPAAAQTRLDVDSKHALQALRPGHRRVAWQALFALSSPAGPG
jgi:hypothetical protein